MGSLLGALDVNNFWQLLDNMSREVPLEEPWNAPCALEWDSMTVKQLIDQKCWTVWVQGISIYKILLQNSDNNPVQK